MKKKFLIIMVLFILLSMPLFALKIPSLDGPVVDKANVLTKSEENSIEEFITQVESQTTAQIAVLTLPSLQGETLERYSIKVAEEWEIGQEGKDNGVIILLALEERKIRIEVGYGLEGDLTDIKSDYIIRNLMLPEFKNGDYARGLYSGVNAVSGVILKTADISPEQLKEAQRTEERRSSSSRGIPINIIIFIIIMVISAISRGGRHGRRRGSALPWFFLGSMMGGSSNRSTGFGGNSSFGGGSGFGGFSGGGGSFGGGGASGGW